jgi:hypothetical protein
MPFYPSLPTSQQLSLWDAETDGYAAEQTTFERHIAHLERDAEAALFNWVECRRAPHASALWCVFADKAFLLEQALASNIKRRSLFAPKN